MDTFKVGTFNLFNLVSPNKKYYGRRVYSLEDYQKKIDWSADQLDTMKADIVGFQEVFHTEALEDLLKKTQQMKKAHYVVAAPNGNLPRVAIASKFPILSHQVIEAVPQTLDIEGAVIPITEFSRPVLIADVRVRKHLIITFVVVHLKSKRPTFNEGEGREDPVHLARGQARALIRRSVEAAALREVLMDKLKHRNSPVILMGDINDSGLAVTSRMVSGEPPHRRFPTDVKRSIWDVLLYQTRDIQARQSYRDMYYTHIHNGHYEALDHIMVSEELVRENPKHIGKVIYVANYNDHLIDNTLTNEKMRNWRSDHGQVVATIEVKSKDREQE